LTVYAPRQEQVSAGVLIIFYPFFWQVSVGFISVHGEVKAEAFVCLGVSVLSRNFLE